MRPSVRLTNRLFVSDAAQRLTQPSVYIPRRSIARTVRSLCYRPTAQSYHTSTRLELHMATSTKFFTDLPYIEPSLKRVRVFHRGEYIVDTKEASLVWLKAFYPYFFFKKSDVAEKYLSKGSKEKDYQAFNLVVGGETIKDAVREYTSEKLKDLIYIEFDKVDAWFEEEEQIFVHPKDPYKRVDVLQSSRHVRVELNGVEVANTTKPRLLFETGLPVRTYIPKTDCHMEYFRPTDYTTACPYKGVANYYSVHVPGAEPEPNSVWWYRTPQAECIQITGYAAFYDNKFDVYVDGELQPR